MTLPVGQLFSWNQGVTPWNPILEEVIPSRESDDLY